MTIFFRNLARILPVLATTFATACADITQSELQQENPSRPIADSASNIETRYINTETGAKRKYLLRLPQGFSEGACANVVFDFHGSTSTAEQQFSYSNYSALADKSHVILVFPDANKTYSDQQHHLAEYWNHAWEANLRERDYDVDFILELVASLKRKFCTKNFYASGMSAGGDMVSALACLADSPFQSYASVTYRYYNEDECKNAPPQPTLSFQGDSDFVVPIGGSSEPWNDPSMQNIMQAWATHNQCSGGPKHDLISSEVTRFYWEDCAAPTQWYLVIGGGHTWPGQPGPKTLGYTTFDISASEIIWEFFHLH